MGNWICHYGMGMGGGCDGTKRETKVPWFLMGIWNGIRTTPPPPSRQWRSRENRPRGKKYIKVKIIKFYFPSRLFYYNIFASLYHFIYSWALLDLTLMTLGCMLKPTFAHLSVISSSRYMYSVHTFVIELLTSTVTNPFDTYTSLAGNLWISI